MSDVMLFGVLRMPYEMAMGDELSRRQFYARAQQATDLIATLESCLRQAREALGITTQCRPIGYETLTTAREHKIRNALAAIDAVLSGVPVKEG